MQAIPVEIEDLLRPEVEAFGCEWVGGEFRGGPSGLLRVYVDHPEGLTLDHCVSVSDALSGVLDVEDPFPGAYRLEVSSPGVERRLFRTEDFARFAGHRVQLRLHKPVDRQKKFVGLIDGVDDQGTITVIVDDVGELAFRFEEVDKANLVYDFQDKKRGRGKKKRRVAR